jgi:hypothetical protein
MTTLADLRPKQLILMIGRCIAVDAQTGMDMDLYGPGRNKVAGSHINLDGSMTAQLVAAPDQIPVSVITGALPFSVGDVLENEKTGETVVCRWSEIKPDGTAAWSSSVNRKVVYSPIGWTVVGNVTI